MGENKVCYKKMMEELDIIVMDKLSEYKEVHSDMSDLNKWMGDHDKFRDRIHELKYEIIDNIVLRGGDLEENLNLIRNLNV